MDTNLSPFMMIVFRLFLAPAMIVVLGYYLPLEIQGKFNWYNVLYNPTPDRLLNAAIIASFWLACWVGCLFIIKNFYKIDLVNPFWRAVKWIGRNIWKGAKNLFALIFRTDRKQGKTYDFDKAAADNHAPTKVSRPITIFTTDNKKIELNNPFRGIFVVGANGSGKSESVAIPLLSEFIREDFCGLIYDFKFPSLANEVEYLKAKHESKTPHYYVDFVNPLQSYRVNPIAPKYLLNTTYAREFASAIITNLMKESIQNPTFWSRNATDILTACIWYLKTHHADKCDLPHVCAMITSNGEKLLNTLAQDEVTAQMTIGVKDAMDRQAEGQIAGVLGTLQSAIAQINTPEFMYVLGGDDFSLDLNNPENPSFVTIGSNPTLPTSIAPLASLIISVATKMMNQPKKKKSFFLFDEMPTCYVPNIEILPNTGRSNKIATVFMIQDLAQLNDGYGDKKADVIFAACNNHFYGKVTSSKTTEVLSKQLGKTDKTFTTQSQNKGNNMNMGGMGMNSGTTIGQSIQEREIMRPAEFTQLKVGEFVAILVESNWEWINAQLTMVAGERDIWQPIKRNEDIYDYYKSVRKDVEEILIKSGEGNKNARGVNNNNTVSNTNEGNQNTYDVFGD